MNNDNHNKRIHIVALLKNASFYSVGAILTPFLGFLLMPVYTRLLSVSEYGIMAIAISFQALMGIVLVLGLPGALSRFYYDNQNKGEKKRYTASVFWFTVFFAAIVTLLFLPAARIIECLLFKSQQPFSLILLLLLSLTPKIVLNTAMSLVQIKIRPKVYSLAELTNALLYHSVAIYLVKIGYGVNGILIAATVAALFTAAFLIYYLKENISFFNYDFNIIKILFKSSIPIMLVGTTGWVMELLDRYFLNYFVGMVEVGLYSLAYKIVILIAFINTLFTQTVPIYLLKLRESNKELGEHLQTEVLRYYMAIALLIVLVLSLFAKDVLFFLTPLPYHGAYRFVPILALSYVFLGGFYILHIGITNAKRFNYLLICFLISGLFNILLNFLLIPHFAGIGAAVATMLSYLVLMILGNYYSQKVYYMKWDYKKLLILFLAFLFFMAIGNIILPVKNLYNYAYKIFILISYCCFVWFAGLNAQDRDIVRYFLKSKKFIHGRR